MESNWKYRLVDLEQRANSVNIALYRLCRIAGVRLNTISRWKQGFSPSMRVFSRDFPKLEEALAMLEREMAVKLIQRINPDAAPRIIAMLQSPNAGDPGQPLGQVRDGRRDGVEAEAGNTGQAHHLAGKPDRAA